MTQVRRGNQAGATVSPQSRSVVYDIRWMYRASITLLFVRLVSASLTVAGIIFTYINSHTLPVPVYD